MNSCSSCYKFNGSSSDICSGHGQCQSLNHCKCNSGYTVYEFQLISCYGLNQTLSDVCSGNGMCIGPNTCQCNAGYTGDDCQGWSIPEEFPKNKCQQKFISFGYSCFWLLSP